MQKLDFHREFTLLVISHLQKLNLNNNSLFFLLKFIFLSYRFDINFLRRIVILAKKLKFTPSLSGDEEKGEK